MDKLARKRPLPQSNRDSTEREGVLMQQLRENKKREILALAKECENLKCAFEQLEQLVLAGAFDEGDDMDQLVEEVELFCDIWESNSSEVYELNVDRSPSPAEKIPAPEAVLSKSPMKDLIKSPNAEASAMQARNVPTSSPQKESLSATQSFFKPSSALASAAALQLGVTNLPTSEASFAKLAESFDGMKERAAATKATTVSSVTRSAPTLSKLLEMPPSVPGKPLPALPALYESAYPKMQATPSQSPVSVKRAEKRKRSQTETEIEICQLEVVKNVEDPKPNTVTKAVIEKGNDVPSVQNSVPQSGSSLQKSESSTATDSKTISDSIKQAVVKQLFPQDNMEDKAGSTPDTELLFSDSNSVNSDNNDPSAAENIAAAVKCEEVTMTEVCEKNEKETNIVQEVQVLENMDSDTMNVELENSTDDVPAANVTFNQDPANDNEELKQIPVLNVIEQIVTFDDTNTPMEEASNPNPDLTFEIRQCIDNPDDSDSNFLEQGPDHSSVSSTSDVQLSTENKQALPTSAEEKFIPFQFELKKTDTDDADAPEDISLHSISEQSRKDSDVRCGSPTTSSSGTSESTVMQPSENVESQLISNKNETLSIKSSVSPKKAIKPSASGQESQSSPKMSSSLDYFPLSPESTNFPTLDSSGSQKPTAELDSESSGKRRQRKKSARQPPATSPKTKQPPVPGEQLSIASTPRSSRNSTDSAKDVVVVEKPVHSGKSPGRKPGSKKDSSSTNQPLTPSKKPKNLSPAPQSDESTQSEDSASVDIPQLKINMPRFDEPTVVLKDYMNELGKHRQDTEQNAINSSHNKYNVSKGSKKSESKSPTPTAQTRSQQQQEDPNANTLLSRRGRRAGRPTPKPAEKRSPDSLGDQQTKEVSVRKTSRSDSPDASKSPSQPKVLNENSKDADSASDSEKTQAKSAANTSPRGGKRGGRRGRGRPQKIKPEQKKVIKDGKEVDEDAAKPEVKEYAKGGKHESRRGSSDRDSSPKIMKEEISESEPEIDKKHDDDDSNMSLPASASPMTSDDSFRVKGGKDKDSYRKQSSPHSSGPASQRSVVSPTTSDRESSDESSDDSDESVRTANSNENTEKLSPRVKRARKDNEYKRWKKSICMIWREASYHKYANVFTQKVTDDVAPGYQSIVNRPMDLTLIKKKIDSGAIMTTEEFQRDMMLMFQNAIMYNSSDHDVYQMAVEMQTDVNKLIQDYLATQLVLEDKIKEPVVPPALRAGRQAKPQLKPQPR